uniref:Uncharacterized protein n=1 Tax=Monodelphis domestica TaxID=13616 RepID=A0A5F8H6K1_MONDO
LQVIVSDGNRPTGSSARLSPGSGTSTTVKMTGSMRKTRLDSLLMEAAMTWEFTTSAAPPGPPEPASPASFTVAFSVDRKRPRLL